MPGKEDSEIPDAVVFDGTETGLVTQAGNSRRYRWGTHILPWLQALFSTPGEGGGGGPTNFRTLAEEDWEAAPYPMDEYQLQTLTLEDMREGVIVTASSSQRVLGMPLDAEVGDFVRIVYGEPEDIFGGGGSPPANEPLILGYFAREGQTGAIVVPLTEDFSPVEMLVNDIFDLQLQASVDMGEGVMFHFWRVVNIAPRRGESAPSGGGGGVSEIVWDNQAYNNNPETGLYRDLDQAILAVQERGGGTLIVMGDNWPYISDYLDASSVDIVARMQHYSVVKPLMTINEGCGFANLRSIKGFRFKVDGPEESVAAFIGTTQSGTKFYDCEVSPGAYPAVRPVIAEMRYLEFHGECFVGVNSIVAFDNPSAQLYMRIRGSTVVDAGAIISPTYNVDVSVGDTAWISPSQPEAASVTVVMDTATPRFISTDISGDASLYNVARQFYNVTPSGADANISAPTNSGSPGQGGVSCYVAKRGPDFDVVISNLTFVPGGGTTYTITEENAVVELIWLPGGIQVKP